MDFILAHLHVLLHPALLIIMFLSLLILLTIAYLFPRGKQANIEYRHLTTWEEDEPVQY